MSEKCSLLSVWQFGIRVRAVGIYHTSGTKTESAALIKRSLMAFNSFSVKKKNPFPLQSSNCRPSKRLWGRHILKGKGKCGVLHTAALGSFQHRKGRKPTPVRLHRHAAISVPAKLNFLNRVIKAAQKNLLTHTHSQLKQSLQYCLISKAKLALNILTQIFIRIIKNHNKDPNQFSWRKMEH